MIASKNNTTTSERLQQFLKENGFDTFEDSETITLLHGNTMVKIFTIHASAEELWRAAAEYLGQKVNGER